MKHWPSRISSWLFDFLMRNKIEYDMLGILLVFVIILQFYSQPRSPTRHKT